MLEFIDTAKEYIVIYYQHYLFLGLLTLFTLIQHWKRLHGSYDDLQEALTHIFFLSMLAWPYVVLVWLKSWVFSWRIFTWAFWLTPITIDFISFGKPWWAKK